MEGCKEFGDVSWEALECSKQRLMENVEGNSKDQNDGRSASSKDCSLGFEWG